GMAKLGVDAAGFAEEIPGAVDVNEVPGGCEDQRRPGGTHDREIGMIEPPGDLAKNVLLGIPHAALLNAASEVRRGATRGGAVDAIVEGNEVFGERAAAGDAGAAILALHDVGPA